MTLAERERQYSPSSMIGGNLTEVIAAYVGGSEATRSRFPPTTHSYGPHSDELVDVFRPADPQPAERPLHVFFHGGYWQELGRRESCFHVAPLLDEGCVVAVPDYSLAPHASLDEIVDQCIRALGWCIDQAQQWGANPNRVIVSGSSAGAHLAAMALAVEPRVRAAMLFSGVYDLAPLIGTYINEAVGITPETAVRLSPIHLRPARGLPIMVVDGEIETDEFHAQSDAFAAAWARHGCAITRITMPGRNHFDVPSDLGRLWLQAEGRNIDVFVRSVALGATECTGTAMSAAI